MLDNVALLSRLMGDVLLCRKVYHVKLFLGNRVTSFEQVIVVRIPNHESKNPLSFCRSECQA